MPIEYSHRVGKDGLSIEQVASAVAAAGPGYERRVQLGDARRADEVRRAAVLQLIELANVQAPRGAAGLSKVLVEVEAGGDVGRHCFGSTAT